MLEGFNYLERYYLLTASEAEKDDLVIVDLEPRHETKEELLLAFAKYIEPTIQSSKSKDEHAQKKNLFQKTLESFRLIFQNNIVKQASAVSGIGALIMLVGVLIFKIDVSQAFLTWFTITFGTLSISIGISSKKETKNDDKNQESL